MGREGGWNEKALPLQGRGWGVPPGGLPQEEPAVGKAAESGSKGGKERKKKRAEPAAVGLALA